jgi:hypothetical protein
MSAFDSVGSVRQLAPWHVSAITSINPIVQFSNFFIVPPFVLVFASFCEILLAIQSGPGIPEARPDFLPMRYAPCLP